MLIYVGRVGLFNFADWDVPHAARVYAQRLHVIRKQLGHDSLVTSTLSQSLEAVDSMQEAGDCGFDLFRVSDLGSRRSVRHFVIVVDILTGRRSYLPRRYYSYEEDDLPYWFESDSEILVDDGPFDLM